MALRVYNTRVDPDLNNKGAIIKNEFYLANIIYNYKKTDYIITIINKI